MCMYACRCVSFGFDEIQTDCQGDGISPGVGMPKFVEFCDRFTVSDEKMCYFRGL